jgi:hypothetical protein
VGGYCVKAYLLILGFAATPIFIIILSIHKWAEPILNTIDQDDDLDDLSRIWSLRGLYYWTRHIKLFWTLRYRWFKSWIALRFYSNHPTIAKGVVAVAISLVAYSESPRSPVIAGATAFYATMIFLQSTSGYAALWTQSVSMTRYDYNGVTDSLSVATEVDNLGLKTADNIEAKLRVIDGPRKLSGSTTPDRRRNHSNPRKLEPKLSKDYSFTFAGERDTVGNVSDRAAVNGELGEIAFAVVEIQTPDQPVETIKYRNISNAETRTREELQELMEGLAENVSVLTEFTRRNYANEDVDEIDEIDDAEADDDSHGTDETNQRTDADEATDRESEDDDTEDIT